MNRSECLNEITKELGINYDNNYSINPTNIIRILFACEDKIKKNIANISNGVYQIICNSSYISLEDKGITQEQIEECRTLKEDFTKQRFVEDNKKDNDATKHAYIDELTDILNS